MVTFPQAVAVGAHCDFAVADVDYWFKNNKMKKKQNRKIVIYRI